MTVFALKIIAVITMILDHVKYAIPQTDGFITKYFGRIAFPIFAFLITEGYIHTHDRKKYIFRLFIFAVISQIPFMLFRTLVANRLTINVLATFLLGILGIVIIDYFNKNEYIPKTVGIFITAIALFVIECFGNFIRVDYRWFGIITVWIFYIFKDKKIPMLILYSLLIVVYYLSMNSLKLDRIDWISVGFAILPAIIILFYNGKQGKKLKYFFYWFYPAHMLILYGISYLF